MTDNLPEKLSSDTYAIMDPAESINIREIFEQNVGPQGLTSHLDLDSIKIPAGGGTSWEVPSIDGTESLKTLEGVVVYWREARAYWPGSFGDSEAGPPQCQSNDCKVGVGNPGGACAQCPYSQWGSDENGGKGQACKLMRLIFLVRKDDVLPMVLALPPTSIKGSKKFFLRLASGRVPYFGVVSSWTLEKTKNAAGIAYSVAVPSVQRRLTAEECEKVKAYAVSIQGALETVHVNLDSE